MKHFEGTWKWGWFFFRVHTECWSIGLVVELRDEPGVAIGFGPFVVGVQP